MELFKQVVRKAAATGNARIIYAGAAVGVGVVAGVAGAKVAGLCAAGAVGKVIVGVAAGSIAAYKTEATLIDLHNDTLIDDAVQQTAEYLLYGSQVIDVEHTEIK